MNKKCWGVYQYHPSASAALAEAEEAVDIALEGARVYEMEGDDYVAALLRADARQFGERAEVLRSLVTQD